MSTANRRHEALSLLRESTGDLRVGDGPVLPFGIAGVDAKLPDDGLSLGRLHEISPATPTLSDDPAATLFTVGVAARASAGTRWRVLWALTRFDLYAPGLEQAGLDPATLLLVEAREDKEVLAVVEDGLRHGSLATVVSEVKTGGQPIDHLS